jgi:hypothetical protein
MKFKSIVMGAVLALSMAGMTFADTGPAPTPPVAECITVDGVVASFAASVPDAVVINRFLKGTTTLVFFRSPSMPTILVLGFNVSDGCFSGLQLEVDGQGYFDITGERLT